VTPGRTRIKFCGMTRPEDLALAAALGVDAVGLIFAPRSPRFLELPQARALRASLPPFVAPVALLMDADLTQVQAILHTVKPALLQFHGSEAPQDCGRWGVPYLKAVPMAIPEGATAYAARYPDAAGFVFDSHAAGEPGGSGRAFDWSALPRHLARPMLLAGGLTPDNVHDAVCAVRPWAVDVSSGIESAPGIKDPDKMRRFVDEVRRADQSRTG
jgi:phosphoribosylanthranilate isomerase